jgi:hypothetical protein
MFAEAFTIGDPGESRDATEPQVFNPSPGPGGSGKQRI